MSDGTVLILETYFGLRNLIFDKYNKAKVIDQFPIIISSVYL